ncbi:hypothetical protein DET50_102264 [Marinobacter pelagius]|uniref:Porin n=1 Tax=Marinobacter pelagius TaxID=379482 RepID=A0A366GZ80_9GAMM|nr:DcaP family trimeric outer membrane transporter [Marinobacter pelagius]RBP33449.1 hypothetical protein DET50_102264 [Marinobacter pelagius]
MQSNDKLRMAIRATAAAAVLGVASQASAVTLNVGDDVEASLYGYARLNASYDIDENIATSTQAGDFSKINTGAAEDNEVTGHFGADAKQTRLGVKATHSSGVAVVVEGDFRGSGNSAGSLRLRHGYGTYKGLLAGRTWSNYNSFVGNTATLDFDGTPGVAGLQDRTEQVRYTSGPLSISLEEGKGSLSQVNPAKTQFTLDPDTGVIAEETVDPAVGDVASVKNSMPDITARLEDSIGRLSYSLGAVINHVEYDTGTADDSVIGFAGFAAGKFALTDMITIQGAVNYSDGANSYMWRTGDNYYGADGYLLNGDIETISSYSASIGTGISLGGGRSINIGYGMATMDWDDAEQDFAGNAGQLAAVRAETETNQAIHANYMWSPAPSVTMGVEYKYLKTEEVGGNDGDANRVMFAAQYNF